MTTWHTPTTVRLQWAASSKLADPLLEELLTVSRTQILQRGTLDYDPAAETDPDNPTEVPVQYRWGQALYARSLWDSATANIGGDIDAIGGDFQVRVYPMSSTILDLISPRIPRIG